MELIMVTYAKEEMIGITEFGKSLGKYLDKVTSNTFNKLAIIRRNKPEAVIIPIQEYENLQKVYDIFEQEEIEQILNNRTNEEKEIAHTKTITIEI